MSVQIESMGEQWREIIEGLFRRGSRYQSEKIMTMAGFVICSIASLAWAFSAGVGQNELGAKFGITRLKEIDHDVFFLTNDSSDHWTNVRVVLDRRYLYKRDELKAGSRATLDRKDFAYFYYIPRTWGAAQWEGLDRAPKPDAWAPSVFEPSFVQIRAEQGMLDIDLQAREGEPSEGAPSASNE